jgi:hypothetical protein
VGFILVGFGGFSFNMVLDPLSAVALAGNVVQFVDFGVNLTSQGGEPSRSAEGALVENLELEAVYLSLRRHCDHIIAAAREIPNPSNLTKGGKERKLTLYEEALKGMRNLAIICIGIAEELLKALDSLKIKGPNSRWKSFRQALNASWTEASIEDWTKRLEHCKQQISFHLLNTLTSVNICIIVILYAN